MADEQTPDTTDDEYRAAEGEAAYTLLVADFADADAAWEAYEALRSLEDPHAVKIEGVVVVHREDDGKLKIQKATDHSTRSGLTWGLVGGAALGLVFPPSILASAAVMGAAGAAVGRARTAHHRREISDDLQNSIAPGHSGIVALVSDPQVVEVRQAFNRAGALVQSAVDKATADDLKAIAQDAESGR
jgi:uncharacterized membrane protein